MLRLQQANVTSDACIDPLQVPKTNVSIKKNTNSAITTARNNASATSLSMHSTDG